MASGKWGAVMGDELETREKLLESAMAEFSENGYMKASLRKICADAGVTTGALYFFFKNKNDLFKAIVDIAAEELFGLLTGSPACRTLGMRMAVTLRCCLLSITLILTPTLTSLLIICISTMTFLCCCSRVRKSLSMKILWI